MDMKIEQRRGSRRFRVYFPTMVSDHTKHKGKGIMLDLALGGCRLESPWTMAAGITLELRVQVPGFQWPLVIDGARVQWVREQFAGLAFVQIRETEQQRLESVIADLRLHGADDAL